MRRALQALLFLIDVSICFIVAFQIFRLLHL
jgi:hypothetical protein